MPIRKIPFIKGGYYHVFNRGNRKQDIFLDNSDYHFFLKLLGNYRKKFNISLLCYTLMPNHYHLLLQQKSADPISSFIHGTTLTYSMYINEKYNLVGSLFQGRFKAKHVNADETLIYLSKYIHRNPKEIIDYSLEEYSFSSYPEYIGKRQTRLCETEPIINFFSKDNPIPDYKSFVEEDISEEQEDHIKPCIFNK